MRSLVRGSLYNAVRDDLPGELGTVARITSQTEKVRQLSSGLLISTSSVALTLVAATIGMFSLVPVVSLIILATSAISGLLIACISRVWKRRYEQALRTEERLSERAGDVLGALRDVIANDGSKRAESDLDDVLRTHAGALTKVASIGGIRVGVIGLTGRVPLVMLFILAPWLLSSGQLSAGALLGAATYLMSGLEPALRTLINTVGNVGLELVTVLNRLARYSVAHELLPGGTLSVDRYDLGLERVTFRYGPHAHPVLREANLRIREGEHIAVLGTSGIGKSTLASLLAGLESPQEGVVRLGGIELDRLRAPWLRSVIALVPQQAYVFAGTVRENLTYLAPEAADAKLDEAVLVIGLEELVAEHGGYDGEINPDALTGGQQQLVTLARVYLSPARVIILDEATCHLDPAVEERAERAFARRSGTLVVIAHRISSALRADRVLLLDNTGLHAGTHGMLLRSSPTYANLVGHWYPNDVGDIPRNAPASGTSGAGTIRFSKLS
ncbi:ATP-binding cassette domain-containing protein [Saccharopolyspora sp. 5N708]|uniref:ATP-binding cassette domain-containing protein n=1 Tax=Saccharopolyspora sp. 5N708 TaxID=3457424 RepID=UPI003FD5AF36